MLVQVLVLVLMPIRILVLIRIRILRRVLLLRMQNEANSILAQTHLRREVCIVERTLTIFWFDIITASLKHFSAGRLSNFIVVCVIARSVSDDDNVVEGKYAWITIYFWYTCDRTTDVFCALTKCHLHVQFEQHIGENAHHVFWIWGYYNTWYYNALPELITIETALLIWCYHY